MPSGWPDRFSDLASEDCFHPVGHIGCPLGRRNQRVEGVDGDRCQQRQIDPEYGLPPGRAQDKGEGQQDAADKPGLDQARAQPDRPGMQRVAAIGREEIEDQEGKRQGEQAERHAPVAELVERVAGIALGGEVAGRYFEGDRRFDIVVRFPEYLRTDVSAIERLPVPLPESRRASGEPMFVPLSELARVEIAPGPNQISRENGKRKLTVTANVRDRDLGSFIAELQVRMAAEADLPSGYWVEYGGT